MSWKYTNSKNKVVTRTLEDGRQESCIATREDVVKWVADGNTIIAADLPPDEPKATKAEIVARLNDLQEDVAALADGGGK